MLIYYIRWNAVCGENRKHGVKRGKIRIHKDYLSLLYANKVHLKNTYVKFRAEDIEIQTDWTIQEEQDY